jgi:hypothetical protein
MNPDIKNTIDNAVSSLVDLVRAQTGTFLEENDDARILVEDRMGRMKEIALEIAKAEALEDHAALDRALSSFDTVKDTMELMAAAVAVNASAASRESFKKALAIVLDYGKQLLPMLIKLAVAAIRK